MCRVRIRMMNDYVEWYEIECEECGESMGVFSWGCDDGHRFYCKKHMQMVEIKQE